MSRKVNQPFRDLYDDVAALVRDIDSNVLPGSDTFTEIRRRLVGCLNDAVDRPYPDEPEAPLVLLIPEEVTPVSDPHWGPTADRPPAFDHIEPQTPAPRGRYPMDVYDDFVASDVLKRFIDVPHNYAALGRDLVNNIIGGRWLTLDGSIVLTEEQYSVLSPLIPSNRGGSAPIPSNRGGSAPIPSNPDQE